MDGVNHNLEFTEKEGYQFLYWESSNTNVIQIPSNKIENPNSYFSPKGTGNSVANITIKAVCAPRLKLNSFAPVNSDEGVAQDSNIEITFNNTPKDASVINIYVNDNIDTTHFNTRSSNSNQIIIRTQKIENASDRFVTSGTPKVKVEIPSGLCYKYTAPNDKEYDVLYGGNGTTLSYKVNSSTYYKVQVNPATSLSGGTIELNPVRSENKYSIGEKITAEFIPLNSDYSFTKWTKSNGNGISFDNINSNPATITIDKKLSTTTTYTINATTDVKTRITSFTPAFSNSGVPCDTSLEIKFNKQMSFNTNTLIKGSDIIIYDQYMNDISQYYSTPLVNHVNDGSGVKTRITLAINPDYSIKNIFGYQETTNIQVYLEKSLTSKDDNVPIDTSGFEVKDSYVILKSKLNRQTESIPPQFSKGDDITTKVAKAYGNDGELGSDLFTPYTSGNPLSSNNIISNAIGYDIYAFDGESGIKNEFTITLQAICDLNGNPFEDEQQIYTINGTLNNNHAKSWFFVSTEAPKIHNKDCIFKMDIIISDKAGNTNIQTYYLVNTKKFDITKGFVYNRYFDNMNVTNIKAGASNSTTEHSDWSNGYGWGGLIGDDTWAVTNSGTNTVIYYRYPKNVKICSFQGTDYYDTIKDGTLWYGNNSNLINSSNSGTQLDIRNKTIYTDIDDNFDYLVFRNIPLTKGKDTYIRIKVEGLSAQDELVLLIPASPRYFLNANGDFQLADGFESDVIKRTCVDSGTVYVSTKEDINLYSKQSNANYLFESRIVSDVSLDGKEIKSDLRSLASDSLKYTTSPTTAINGLQLVSYTPAVINDDRYGLTFKISNSSSYDSTNDIFTCYSNGKENVYKMNSSGQITVYLPSSEFVTFCNDKKIRIGAWKSGYKTNLGTFTATVATGVTLPSNPTAVALEKNAPMAMGSGDFINIFGEAIPREGFWDGSDGSGIQLNNGEYIYQYIVVPNPNGLDWSVNYDEIVNHFNNYNPITSKVKPVPCKDRDGHSYNFCFPRVPYSKDCLTYVKVTDNNGNYVIQPVLISNLYSIPNVENKLSLSVELGNSNLTLTASGVNGSTIYDFLIQKFNDNTKTWSHTLNITDPSQYNELQYSTYSYLTSTRKSQMGSNTNAVYTYDIDTTESSFYKIITYNKDATRNSLPTYFYTSPTTCTKKNVLASSSIATILCNKPTLYYACYSSVDYGTDMDKWELYGAHTDANITSSDVNADTSQVPSGMKFVVIAHFADNTSAMSSVMTK